MRIYLDACAINRLTDDQRQARILAEAEAVEQVLDLITTGSGRWIASSALRDELERNPNEAKRPPFLWLFSILLRSLSSQARSHFSKPRHSPPTALVPSTRCTLRLPKRHMRIACLRSMIALSAVPFALAAIYCLLC